MKSILNLRRLGFGMVLLLLSNCGLFAQGFLGGPIGTPGYGQPDADPYTTFQARQRTYVLDDLDLTALTKMDELMAKQVTAVAAARKALQDAVYAETRNPGNISATVDALAQAELELALARADTWARFQAEHKFPPEKIAAMKAQIAGGNIGGRPL